MKIAVLASGAGTTFQNIFDEQKRLSPSWQVSAVITDNPKAEVIARARRGGLPVQIVSPKDFTNFSEWDRALRSAVDSTQADIVFFLGFLRRAGPEVLGACGREIYNVHPSLLPRHGGKGMYGRRVHEAVIAGGDTQTGVTIHRVNENYDEGQVMKRAFVDVRRDDTAITLEARVKAAEIALIVDFLNSF